MGALFGKLTVRIMWDGGCGTADTVEGSVDSILLRDVTSLRVDEDRC